MIEYYYSINGNWELNTPIKDYFSDRWDTITLTRRELTLIRQILRHTKNRLEGLLYLHGKMWDMERIDGDSYERLTKALIDSEFYVEHEREITQEDIDNLYGSGNKEQLTDELETAKRGLELIVQEAIRTKELVSYNDVAPCYALPLLIDYIVTTYTKVEKTNEFLEKEKNPKA